MRTNSGRIPKAALLVTACVATVGLTAPQAQATSSSGGYPGDPRGLTFWQGKGVPCPPTQNDSARPGAVLRGRFDDGCQRLGHLLMTVHRPRNAVAEPQPGDGGWEVDVTLNARQRREFDEVTSAEAGHQLAMVLDGRLLSAPTVEEAIPTGHFQIVGLPRGFAEHLARRLTETD